MDNDGAKAVERYKGLVQRRDVLERKRMEAQVKLDGLREEYKRLVGVLKDEFGVSSLAEAKSLLEKLRGEIETQSNELEARLDEFEKAIGNSNGQQL